MLMVFVAVEASENEAESKDVDRNSSNMIKKTVVISFTGSAMDNIAIIVSPVPELLKMPVISLF